MYYRSELLKSIVDKWKCSIMGETSPWWHVIWLKHRACKEAIFLWFVLHKVVPVNEWRGQISDEVYKSCYRSGPPSAKSVEYVFYDCMLAH